MFIGKNQLALLLRFWCVGDAYDFSTLITKINVLVCLVMHTILVHLSQRSML